MERKIMKTIGDLQDAGYTLFSIYKGNLMGCACGCGGIYYGDDKETMSKYMENKIN